VGLVFISAMWSDFYLKSVLLNEDGNN